jgi:hypothetical protein
MKEPPPKSLGQIAYEVSHTEDTWCSWAKVTAGTKKWYSMIARAIEREVKKRERYARAIERERLRQKWPMTKYK